MIFSLCVSLCSNFSFYKDISYFELGAHLLQYDFILTDFPISKQSHSRPLGLGFQHMNIGRTETSGKEAGLHNSFVRSLPSKTNFQFSIGRSGSSAAESEELKSLHPPWIQGGLHKLLKGIYPKGMQPFLNCVSSTWSPCWPKVRINTLMIDLIHFIYWKKEKDSERRLYRTIFVKSKAFLKTKMILERKLLLFIKLCDIYCFFLIKNII